MSKQYLILIEQLVREGRSEREIEQIVERAVSEDERAGDKTCPATSRPISTAPPSAPRAGPGTGRP